MTATIYELSPELHWYIVKIYKDVDNELLKDLQAYQEYYQGQVRIEYRR